MKKFTKANIGPFAMTVIFIVAIAICLTSISLARESFETTPAPTEEEEDNLESLSSHVVYRNGDALGQLDEASKTLLSQYFGVWYGAMATLTEKDLTQFFTDTQGDNALLDQSELSYAIGLRHMQTNDLTMTAYTCGLSITQVTKEKNGTLTVALALDESVNFSFISDITSYSAGILHAFELTPQGDGYTIASHTLEDDVDSGLASHVSAGMGSYADALAATKEALLADAKENLDTITQARADAQYASETQTTPAGQYDRDAAVSYAMKWTDGQRVVRNPQYNAYDDYGGNCNNFISQCLAAGGIPMDTQDSQWKWYDDESNGGSGDWGRSPSWTGVDAFYTYAQDNAMEDYGLVADTGANLWTGQAGDILQMGADGQWFHSVIITQVITGDDGKRLDYLTNSNTTDRVNYPMCAYDYGILRLIAIKGYNP